MTMPSLSRNLRSTLARSPTRDRLPTLQDQILRLPGRLQVWLDAIYGYSLSCTRWASSSAAERTIRALYSRQQWVTLGMGL